MTVPDGWHWNWIEPPDGWLGPLRAIWDDWPEHRKHFCRGMSPEKFLADIHGYGWSPEMIAELERQVRRRCQVEPEVPVIEHMLDAAIAVRYRNYNRIDGDTR